MYTFCVLECMLRPPPGFNRAQMDAWVSCNAWLTTNGGGSQNEWLSIEDDGCS